ncbi:type II toxin-antitoxin system VapC family toxin [Autumnicola psychrophila]|uniref:Ribonuclease VapC n=1 Tax=Autumnicola psychrophila TaxID=3075592 RepID=A0ABU3DT28_9FLAO|nr:type II toxin-antitoxin system VapC family toxin [Zunongwangia sp. F225]MDT0686871.1 type II toxin-antitoxin system VapC family toxin [Zunongwangia sp. F225]
MSGNKIFVDTNILLYFLNGEKEVIEILFEKEIIISFITELELLSFPELSPTSEKIIVSLLNNCSIKNISTRIKSLAIETRKNFGLKLPDAIIAATALDLNIPLITADKQFGRVDPLEVILYTF